MAKYVHMWDEVLVLHHAHLETKKNRSLCQTLL